MKIIIERLKSTQTRVVVVMPDAVDQSEKVFTLKALADYAYAKALATGSRSDEDFAFNAIGMILEHLNDRDNMDGVEIDFTADVGGEYVRPDEDYDRDPDDPKHNLSDYHNADVPF